MDKLNNFDKSGRIVVMSDSSCIDSASPSLTKCYWLLEKLVRIATEEVDKDSSLMIPKYQLPNDYQTNERVKYMTYENLDFDVLSQQIYKQSHLNSQNQQCNIKGSSF